MITILQRPLRQQSGSSQGGVQGGRVAHRVQVCHDLGGGLVGQLGADVGQPVEPTPDPDGSADSRRAQTVRRPGRLRDGEDRQGCDGGSGYRATR